MRVHQVAISSLAAIAPLWCHCTAGPHMWGGGPTHSWAMGTYGVPCMAIPLYTLGRPYIWAYMKAYMRGGGSHHESYYSLTFQTAQPPYRLHRPHMWGGHSYKPDHET